MGAFAYPGLQSLEQPPGKEALMREAKWLIAVPVFVVLVVLLALSGRADGQEGNRKATGRICTSDTPTCSVELSRLRWPAGSAVNAYLGSAGDAALAAFSRTDGPLLLVPPGVDRIPYVVYEAIVDLAPRGVIAVGAVSDAVLLEASLSPSELKARWDELDRKRAAQGDDLDRKLDRLAMCESGMRADAHNPSQKYHGAFQYDLPTWREAGQTGDPHTYSYAHQKAVTREFGQRVGWQRWPTCSRHAGLR